MRASFASIAGCAVLVSGCIDPFNGSRITFNLIGVPPPCQLITKYKLKPPTTWKPCTNDEQQDRFVAYYELWATVRRSAVAYLGNFTVQRHLFADEQIAFEKEGKRLYGGKPFQISREGVYRDMSAADQKATLEYLQKIAGVYSITSFSPTMFEPDNVTFSKNFFVGRHDQMTLPHNGIYLGPVQGSYPIGSVTVGGAEMNVVPVLDQLDSIMVTVAGDDPDRKQKKPSDLVVLIGTTGKGARGVTNIDAVCPLDRNIVASVAVYTRLDEEEYF